MKQEVHLQSTSTAVLPESSEPPSLSIEKPSSDLSVDLEQAAQLVNVQSTVLEGIWVKASRLLCDTNAISLAPGQDKAARMVLSSSGKVPHLVVPKKGGKYACDSNCPNFKSLGICSHTVAVAELNHHLERFLSLTKISKRPTLTLLLTATMPKSRGRKGGATPQRRKKAVYNHKSINARR